MNYVWILSASDGETIGVFTKPELAFRSLERLFGRGLVEVLFRQAKLWSIHVRDREVLLCERHRLRSTPISL